MKTFACVTLTLASLVLASCRFPDFAAERHFVVVANPGMPAPILLNETTGESWRLTDSGWQSIAMVKEGATTANDARKEIDRRKQIYEALSQNSEARKIVAAYKSGVTGRDAARSSLQAIVPQSLGSLPPGTEDGNWSAFSK